MARNTVIFDFDGTIADSFSTIVSIFHELRGRKNQVSNAEIIRLRGMTIRGAAAELRIPKWKAPWLLVRGRHRMSHRMREVPLFEGMQAVFEALHTSKYQVLILSSNSRRNVEKFLQAHDLEKYFKDIYGSAGLLGKDRPLKRLARRNGVIPADCIYIGDEPRDIEAAQHAGMDCIAVTWGFNAARLLKDHNPYALASMPAELPAIIARWRAV